MTIDVNAAAGALRAFADRHPLPTAQTQRMFRDLLPDALERAVTLLPDGTCFVATGDLPAMWLRDATFQVLPYVYLADEIPALAELARRVLRRELRFVRLDPYANAFNETPSGAHWSDDETDVEVNPQVWERKFEIDTLCAPLLLALRLIDRTGDTSILDDEFWATFDVILSTFETEQRHDSSPYFFRRAGCAENDTLPCDGRGTPVERTGMIWNGFRPSDNRCELGYHVPANMFASSVLGALLPLIGESNHELARRASTMIAEIEHGIEAHAVLSLPNGRIGFAYEVDGLGGARFMDDANTPSLLSLPYLGAIDAESSLWQATKSFVLSAENPYFYRGRALSGIGSEHTPKRYVWPIALAMEGLVSRDPSVKADRLERICATSAQTGQCHEGVHADDPTRFTRTWFSWANMTYCQLALDYLDYGKRGRI
ncbi:Uncharacterized conserved protein UCP028846 [Coriobacterium glomerans PW2]|uniref:Uncharacterized conserved protein UCP028846 n=1 Tax=Coriobacterium glomerans (strain ATCC 49209 / DSM 20642 / JCM 10262 / PW2) TaxID=700015 RepID=F2NBA8_CORGP|nr:glycoside hydrolase family 125 protein [Coriobacterium glomerans]AEB06644.1 Uncharacterized conserved protein UCP028846 [Coriobacterium glomerans PW2]